MTTEQSLLLMLLSEELLAKPSCGEGDPVDVNWELILQEARQQTVGGMAAEAALRRNIPNVDAFRELGDRVLASNIRVAYSQEELIRLLGDHPYAILKGMAAASFYPKPHQRVQGDVDFLIDPAELEELRALLTNSGYENIPAEHPCHTVFCKPGADLEMHFEIAGIPLGKVGDRVRAFMKDALEQRQETGFDAWRFSLPSEKHHAAVLLLHMQHHMLGEGLGLRHLCDWAAFVQKTCTMDFWQELNAFLKEIGLFSYAEALTATCHLFLGTACPPWAAGVEEDLCRDLMEDILAGGNFGRKDRVRSAGGYLISEHGKNGTRDSMVKNIWKTLAHSTKLHYPQVAEKPWLWAVYFPRRTWQLLVRVMTKNIAIRPASLQAAKERKSVYDRLHVFETDEKE